MTTIEAKAHTIELTRDYGRSADDAILTRNMDEMLSAINTSSRVARGWKMSLRPISEGSTEWYRIRFLTESMTGPRRYSFFFDITPTNARTMDEVELPTILKTLDAKGASYKGNPYVIATLDGVKYTEHSIESQRATKAAKGDLVGYAPFEVPDNITSYFDRLYGVDAQRRRLLKTVKLAVDTDWAKRVNTVFVGPPGCGKTEMCRALKMGVGDASIHEVDATAMTKAGVLQDLDAYEELPRVFVIEEIEKANAESLSFLLGIMDTRGEIRKTTARGKIERDVKVLVIATVNDYKRFSEMNYGALASRFSNVVFFNRPDDELLTRILRRELDDVVGNGTEGSGKAKYTWIKPTLEYCKEVDNRDPRFVIAICLTGQDDLLTGEYQADLRATRMPSESVEVWEDK